jgi:hypothetical protein
VAINVPSRQSTQRESPALATTTYVRVTSATTAVEPACELLLRIKSASVVKKASRRASARSSTVSSPSPQPASIPGTGRKLPSPPLPSPPRLPIEGLVWSGLVWAAARRASALAPSSAIRWRCRCT